MLILVFYVLNNAGTHSEKIIKGYTKHRVKIEDGKVTHEAKFEVPMSFGDVGAVGVENKHSKEMYLEDTVLQGLPTSSVHFNCYSWLEPNVKRIFFTNKVYGYMDTIRSSTSTSTLARDIINQVLLIIHRHKQFILFEIN